MKLSQKRSNFEKTKPGGTTRDSNTIFTPGALLEPMNTVAGWFEWVIAGIFVDFGDCTFLTLNLSSLH